MKGEPRRSAAEEMAMPRIVGGVTLMRQDGDLRWSDLEFSGPWIDAVLATGALEACRYRVVEEDEREVADPAVELRRALSAPRGELKLVSSIREGEGTRLSVLVRPNKLTASLSHVCEPGESAAIHSQREVALVSVATHVPARLPRRPSRISGHAALLLLTPPRVFPPVQRPVPTEPLAVMDGQNIRSTHPECWRRLLETPFPEGASRTLDGDLLTLCWMEADYTDPERVRDAMALAALWMARALGPSPDPNFNSFGDEPCRLPPHPAHAPLLRYDRDTGRGVCEIRGDGPASIDEAALAEVEGWMRSGVLPDGAPLTSLGVVTGSRAGAVALADRIQSFTPTVLAWQEDGQWWRLGAEGDWLRPGTERYARIEARLPPELRR